MTISVQDPFTVAVANGLTNVFPYTFKLLSDDDLLITLDGVTQTTGFTVSGIGADAGGNVTFSVAPSPGVTVALERNPVLNRIVDYQQFGIIDADILDTDIDRIWIALQYMKQLSTTSIKIPFSTTDEQTINLNSIERANSLLSFDEFGNVSTTQISAIPTSVVAGSFTVDTFSGNGSQTAFTLSRDPGVIGNVLAFIGQDYVQQEDYEIVGTTLTFDVAPVSGTNNVEIRQSVALEAGSPADGTVTYNSLSTTLANLRALSTLNSTPGLVEQTGAATFTKRTIGNAVGNIPAVTATSTASDTVAGLVEKATSAEMAAGISNKYPDAALVKAMLVAFGGVISYTGTGGITSSGASLAVSDTIPLDNTIPQNTEGHALLDVTITPSRVGAVIEVDAEITCNVGTSGVVVIAMFAGVASNAVACDSTAESNSVDVSRMGCLYRHTAASTSPITFSLRGGPLSGAATFNSTYGAANLGGSMSSFIRAREVG